MNVIELLWRYEYAIIRFVNDFLQYVSGEVGYFAYVGFIVDESIPATHSTYFVDEDAIASVLNPRLLAEDARTYGYGEEELVMSLVETICKYILTNIYVITKGMDRVQAFQRASERFREFCRERGYRNKLDTMYM